MISFNYKPNDQIYNISFNKNIEQKFDDEVSFVTRWDSQSERIFTYIFSVLSIPSNLFLILFFASKIHSYKRFNKNFAPKLKHVYAANCFNTYLLEICSFDIIICVHLLTDAIFQHLHEFKLTKYESVFDVSQFY